MARSWTPDSVSYTAPVDHTGPYVISIHKPMEGYGDSSGSLNGEMSLYLVDNVDDPGILSWWNDFVTTLENAGYEVAVALRGTAYRALTDEE